MLKIADIILIIVLLTAAFLSNMFLLNSNKIDSAVAVVKVDGVIYDTISLDADGIYPIEDEHFHAEIEIKNKEVRMLSSSCSDKICVEQGFIHNPNEFIVCLPNKIMIEIQGDGDENGIDAITK